MTVALDEEYRALHGEAVWMDRSTRDARIEVRGPDRIEWLHGLLTQDIATLAPGQGAYAAYLTPQGRMVADLQVFHRGDSVLLETPAPARASLLSRLDQFVIMEDVTVTDVSDRVGCLTVCGPAAAAWTAACTGLDRAALEQLPEYGHVALHTPDAFVAATRAFGVEGFDLFGSPGDLATWHVLLGARAPHASESLLETARIEAGRPRFGVDMHEDTIPLEAGIESRAMSFGKGCYVGQEVVIRILHRGQGRVARRLVWVSTPAVGSGITPWRAGEHVHLGDRVVGAISSACWSPARAGVLGMAMLHRDATGPGTAVLVDAQPAVVHRLP